MSFTQDHWWTSNVFSDHSPGLLFPSNQQYRWLKFGNSMNPTTVVVKVKGWLMPVLHLWFHDVVAKLWAPLYIRTYLGSKSRSCVIGVGLFRVFLELCCWTVCSVLFLWLHVSRLLSGWLFTSHVESSIRLIYGSLLVLGVANSGTSGTDTRWLVLLLLFCFLAVLRVGGGAMCSRFNLF